jgi:hypothetical protein
MKRYIHALLITPVILLTLFFILGETSWRTTLTETISSIPVVTQRAAVSDFNSSLVAYYTFDDTTNDSAGSNNGTASGGPTYVAGKIGRALSFDGVDDYVNMGSGSGLTGVELQGNGGMSISFWLNTSTLANRVLLTKGTGSGSPLSISINSAGRLSFFRKYDGATHLNVRFNNQVVADNVWRHFVFTWNGDPDVGSVKLYKDGVLQIGGGDSGSGTKVADSTSWPLYAGYPALNAGFAGSLDDLRIYNRTLSPLEISELYAYNGNGDGAVTQQSSPVPGVCGSLVNTCSTGTFADTVDSSSNYLWSCGGSGGGATADCSLAIPTQTPVTYTLTVSKNGTGSGTVSGGSISCGNTCSQGNSTAGTSITLLATPTGSDTFTGWSGGGCSGAGTCTVNISSNTTITATFVAPTTPTLSGDCAPTNVRCVGPGQEYATVQACAAVAQPGDTCLVYPGVYSERVNVNRDGVSGSPITFAAKGVVTVCGFDFTNSDYVRVIGFVLDTNAGSCTISYANVNISGTNNYLEFWDNVFRDALYNGIRLGVNDFINNSVVVGNTFSNFGVGNGSGVAVGIQGNNNLISYNELYNIHPDGFVMFGSNNRWTNNYTHDFSEVSGGHSDLFQTGSRPAGWNYTLIEANFQVGMGNSGDEHVAQISNGQAAGYCSSSPCGAMTENIFRNNVWNNISSGTVGINQSFDGPITYTRYYNNTTADAAVKYPTIRYGIAWYGPGTSNSFIHNNIEYESWGSAAVSNLEGYYVTGGLTADYNLAYDPDGNVTFTAPWTSQLHARSNVNPQFVSFSSKDFHLSANSPAIDSAGNLTTVTQSGSNVSTISVSDAGFFRGDNPALNQYGGNLVVGDLITIGNGATADTRHISTINGNNITLTSPVSVVQGEPVYWGESSAPDIGAFPYKSSGYGISGYLNMHDGGRVPRTVNTVAMTVNDSSLVRFVEFYIDDVLVWVDASAPYTYSWNTGGDTVGTTHTIRAVARPRYAGAVLKYEDRASVVIDDSGTSPTVPSVNDPAPDVSVPVVPLPTTPTTGDFNHDGLINSVDFSLLVSSWNKSSTTYDLNGDGLVNTLDYAIMAQHWSR